MTKTPDSVTSRSRCFVYIVFLWGMKDFVLFMYFLFLCSCSLEQIGHGPRSDADGVWRGPSYGKHMSGTLYAVAMDYPDGYDWRADLGSGPVDGLCIVMFADGAPVLKIPVGNLYETDSDPQRLRIRSGHLYTDYTDGMETVIKRDGEEIQRYDAVEEIVDLQVLDGAIHTLCRPVSDAGFVYRVDGKETVFRENGTLFGGLRVYDNSVRFCFSNQSAYYKVMDGKVTKVDLQQDVLEVADMCVIEDGVYLLAYLAGFSGPVLMNDGTRKSVDYFGFIDVASCKFMMTDSLCIRVRNSHPGLGKTTDILWFGDDKWVIPQFFSRLASVWVDKSGWYAVSNQAEDSQGMIFSNGKEYELPADLYVYGDGCVVSRDTTLYVGLTSGKGRSPVIWKDGTLDTLDVNGPLICLR